MNRPQRRQELIDQILELQRQIAALEAERREVERGCGRRLAPDEWFRFCAGSDHGSISAYCTECGGDLKLAEDEG